MSKRPAIESEKPGVVPVPSVRSGRFQIFPHGLSLGQGEFRPAMIFKDKDEREVLPVWLDTLEANLILAQTQSRQSRTCVHKASLLVLGTLKTRLKSLTIDDVKAQTQFATFEVIQGDKIFHTKVKASEALSLAINAGVTFFTNQDVIEKSRAISLEMLLHESGPRGSGTSIDPQDLH